VGKQRLAVCIMVGPLTGEPRLEFREFGTITAELESLRQWWKPKVSPTSLWRVRFLWKPVFNVLEDRFGCIWPIPRRSRIGKATKRTRRTVGGWLAHLLRHAMIRPSFVPPRGLRELRDLTRRRRKMIGVGTSERNRVDKILQDANVKLSNTLSDILGGSGQWMLESLLEGKASPRGDRAVRARPSEAQDSADYGGSGRASTEWPPSPDD